MWWVEPTSRRQRVAWAFGVYALTSLVYFAFAAPATLREHTPWNHYALLADGWLDGRFHLNGPPPDYTGNNDFARFSGQWYVVFPPFPAVLLVPLVYLAGTPEHVQDGQFFIWLAGLGPAVLLLVLEKLKRVGASSRSFRENLFLALLMAFGTVYFFTAEQGTVWYAAHVVAVTLVALFLLFALDAEKPVLAGWMLGLAFLTRPPVLLAGGLFVVEALRASLGRPANLPERTAVLAELDVRKLLGLLARFVAPIAFLLGLSLLHNQVRFGDPFEFGYRFLDVAWRARIEKWGLFDYHYLGRNLAVILTSLPWWDPAGQPRLQVSGHGLALWLTTPAYFWLLWPKKAPGLARLLLPTLYVCAFLVALPTLFYQNTGWVQFGYRFSNDYVVVLFPLLALGGRSLRGAFAAAALYAVLVNGIGAATFNRSSFAEYYASDRAQPILHHRD